jgi:hypothetical protein
MGRTLLKAVALSASLLSLASCTSLETALLNSDIGRQAVFQTEYKFVKTFDEQYRIINFSQFNQEDPSPNEPYLLYIYGFGGTAQEFLDEEKNEENSRLGVMKDVFENRVLLANYPSCTNLNNIFSGIEKNLINFIIDYMEKNHGKKPRIFIEGHSMGVDFERMFSRKYPGYIERAELVAGVNEGVDMGIFTDFIRENYPKYIERILMQNGQSTTKENYQCIDDLIKGSNFLKELNTPTKPLGVEYILTAFLSKKDNLFIPGLDDGVTSVNSALAINLIKNNKFENVRIRNVILFEGADGLELDHSSINNLNILRKTLEYLKSDQEISYTGQPSLENVTRVPISTPCPIEEGIRNKERELIKNATIK